MQSDSVSESLTYVSAEPDINSLRYAYDQSVVELEAYFDLCRESYDERRNWWPGKSRDLRKHGADAFPGKVHLIWRVMLLMSELLGSYPSLWLLFLGLILGLSQ